MKIILKCLVVLFGLMVIGCRDHQRNVISSRNPPLEIESDLMSNSVQLRLWSAEFASRETGNSASLSDEDLIQAQVRYLRWLRELPDRKKNDINAKYIKWKFLQSPQYSINLMVDEFIRGE
jgi:uncharacterized protein YcfL